MKEKNISVHFDTIDTCITYIPLGDEIDPWGSPFVSKTNFTTITPLPQDTEITPLKIAEDLKSLFQDKHVCILIPDRKSVV